MVGLTPKQRAFCHAYVETQGNAPESAMQAYDCSSRESARVMAHKALHNPDVLEYLSHLMAVTNLPIKALDALEQAMDARKVVNGRLTDQPDHRVRAKAASFVVDMVMKVGRKAR